MLVQKIIWWLWNQMFQYAYIKALSLRNQTDFLLDLWEFSNYFRPYELKVFAIEKKYANPKQVPRYESLHSSNKYLNHLYFKIREFAKKRNPQHYIESEFAFLKPFTEITLGYIEWYFQSELYFKDFESEIRKDFTFVSPATGKNLEILEKIQTENSVSVHIRRWDYLKGNNINIHWVCSLDYYQQAINYIKSKIDYPVFYFFSDDIARVRENIKVEQAHYIDWNSWSSSWEDMRLMSHCKHNIIANSSFSRWGGWLNNNPEKIVIAPKKWFENPDWNPKDILPQSRFKI